MTTTSSYGSSKREGHNATAFYARFTEPVISDDETIGPRIESQLICGDSRDMSAIPGNTIALVATSPPYFAGKDYERALGQNGIPESYAAYLDMLFGVFAECVRVLEPGGRIAVNVANLGRKPYRSLSADVIAILEHLGLLLRGEIIWIKAEGASGSCAWGTFGSPLNPVMRDVTERIIVASKGRFDRALHQGYRIVRGLPHEVTITKAEFMEYTLDTWRMRPASARKIGHPAPFPVELPARLIKLHTYKGDCTLDPFCGAGSAAVAAVQLGRRYVGYDTEASYIELAAKRIAAEGKNA